MGSQSRRFRASETVDSELGYWYLLLFLCLVGFLRRPVDYGHTYQSSVLHSRYHGNNSMKIHQILDTANPGDNFWEEMEDLHSSDLPILHSSGDYHQLMLPVNMSWGDIKPLSGTREPSLLLGDLFDRVWSPSCGLTDLSNRTLSQIQCYMDSGNVLVGPQRRPWFMVSGMEQIELVIDYKIPKGTSTESSLNLPSSAICLDSIPKIILTLLRDEAIEIMGIIKELCHIEECSNDTGVAHYVIGLSPDNDFAKVIPIIIAGTFTLVITLTMARKRIRDVVLFKSNNEFDRWILQESDSDDSYLADQILYENLLKEAELVSEGSSGRVFKVRFLELECAMKVFHSFARMDFRKESITLLNLSHPHIVKLFCSFRKSFIIMELMDEDLYSFITKIRERRIDYEMPLEVALDVMLQIAEGMSYLHRQGIAHQDLKSLNILLKLRGGFQDPDFQIIAKVADFGSARRFNPRYPTSFVLLPNMDIGTRSWRAPELFHPRGSFLTRFFGLNPRVLPKPLDIYGFAVICSELLTKQIPFSNDQDLRVAVLASKLREGHRPALPSTGSSEGLLALIKDCWHQDPVLRPEFHEVCARLIEVKSSWMSRGQRPES